MEKTTRVLLLLLVIAILGVAGFGLKAAFTGNDETQNIKIGAILPLSGPAAIWGETLRDGMQLAKQELVKEGITVQIIYEDSQAKAAGGISAYNKLKEVDNVDIMFSAFSRVSVPLIALADEDNMPLIMTLVSAKGVAAQSRYAFRFYSDETQYVTPHFNAQLKKEKYQKIAVLYVNDEYGVSVNDAIEKSAKKEGIEIVAAEAFNAGTTDFRTHLTKLQDKNPQALLFVGAVPPELFNVLKQVEELKFSADFFEASVLLSVESILAGTKGTAEGAFTIAFPFTLEQTGSEFKNNYKEAYAKDPFFSAALGYDMVKLVAQASDGKPLSGTELSENILALKTLDTLNGPVTVKSNGEINPPLYEAQIVNGKLVAVN